jgi:hypothetical protein
MFFLSFYVKPILVIRTGRHGQSWMKGSLSFRLLTVQVYHKLSPVPTSIAEECRKDRDSKCFPFCHSLYFPFFADHGKLINSEGRRPVLKKENLLFLTLSIITVLCIMAIGVAVAERSLVIAIVAILGIFLSMGLGFSRRKKNESNHNSF